MAPVPWHHVVPGWRRVRLGDWIPRAGGAGIRTGATDGDRPRRRVEGTVPPAPRAVRLLHHSIRPLVRAADVVSADGARRARGFQSVSDDRADAVPQDRRAPRALLRRSSQRRRPGAAGADLLSA